MAMNIEQYHNQRRYQEWSFNPGGQRLLREEEQWAILVNLLLYIHGSFIRTTHCVHNLLLQASFQPSPVLEILISNVYFTLHPSIHPAIMPPAIKSHQNSNFTFSQAGFSHFLPVKGLNHPLISMAITQCAWEWKQWARRDEITALHFSEAPPVDGKKTIHRQRQGRDGDGVRAAGFLGHWAWGCEAGHPQ